VRENQSKDSDDWEAGNAAACMEMYNRNAMFKLETAHNLPLTQWEDGSIRITGSRAPIESILHHFKLVKLGASAERIQERFPSLTLPEIYGAVFYYLQNTEAVEE
jgi:uncharacterized protein (DUF433 family)